MGDKEKQLFNNGNEHRETDNNVNEQDIHQTKRHYYGFGEKVVQQDRDEQKVSHVEAEHVTYETSNYETDAEKPRANAQTPEFEMYTTMKNDDTQPANEMIMRKIEQAPTYHNFTVSENKKRKRKNIMPYFLTFVASILVVGGFMFLSDKLNWFTGGNVVSSVPSNTSSNSSQSNAVNTVSKNYLEGRPTNISDLFKASSPAVVKIETYSEVKYNNNSLFNDPFFRQFFGDNYFPQQKSDEGKSELQQTGMGTGFFFDEEGYILTNEHVIGDAKEIRVIVEGYDEPFIAELLGSSFDLDLAVLKLNEEIKFPTLEIGNSDHVEIGDWVVAIGNPYGFDHTLTVGVISAKERPISISDTDGVRNYKNLLQTDASINPGNSGGPLINLNGQVIGINTAVSSQAQGIGFAIPTATITDVLEYLKENKEIPKEPIPFIGVNMSQLTESMLEGTGLEKAEGVRVESIIYASPAHKAGINQYDIITKVDDEVIKSPDQLGKYIKTKQVGDRVQLYVNRRGENITVSVIVGNQNDFATK